MLSVLKKFDVRFLKKKLKNNTKKKQRRQRFFGLFCRFRLNKNKKKINSEQYGRTKQQQQRARKGAW